MAEVFRRQRPNDQPIEAVTPTSSVDAVQARSISVPAVAVACRPDGTDGGVGDPNDYSSVDASVKAGDIDAGVFGQSKSGLLQRVTWSGPGKYTLRANLGAGDLVLRSK
jgi:hypothetical protein